MNKTEITSLLKLLEDPDGKVYSIVRDKIMDNSEMFKIYLENYHSLSIDNLALERSEHLLDEIFFKEFEEELVRYLKNPDSTLLQGALLLERYFNRDVDIKQLEENCDKIIKSVWLELNDQLTGFEKIQVINKVLFREHKFKKYPVGEFKEEYISFTNCISYRKYISPTISLLYCIIAQQANVPLFPADIPGIFLLAYKEELLSQDLFSQNRDEHVFYIHPYDEGGLVNPQIIEKYLKMQKISENISDIDIKTYTEFLFHLFELRIMILKQKNENGFEIDYAEKVMDIYRDNNIYNN
ncbi:MAG: transglutaminase-like domain-containing protein [Bacteroidales bacterium]|jgi:regulator of sirC expression with transglutaminase-like and TPR domain|nr:transglutaminase-like domain-containing protein [Bacteroidales bacterium]